MTPSSGLALNRLLRIVRIAAVAALLIGVALLIYWPALHGGMIWDDDGHITKPRLMSLEGLKLIWIDPRVTQQYYPLLHTVFWIQGHLWAYWLPEGNMTGYHVVNVLFHALNALLVWRVARRIVVDHPDADRSRASFWTSYQDKAGLLAAVIFLLHPVMVESVAWITELKNGLSGFFCLLAMLFYLRYDETRRAELGNSRLLYALSLGIFILALLSKTVTASLPGTLLVIFWWKRGRVTWRDAKPLIPYFILGGLMGLMTAYVEKNLIGAEGAEFDYGIAERFLIAGRVVWFYLGKLLWPAKLIFMYEKWDIDRSDYRQWMFLIGIAALMLGLLRLAWKRGSSGLRLNENSKIYRAPLAMMLVFGGTLLPVLGFFNVYPFRYCFVADHFQYLASLAVIVTISAILARLPWRFFAVILAGLGAVFGYLSWMQAQDYIDSDTLYLNTLKKNPHCWMAHNNYGADLLTRASAADRLNRPDLSERFRAEAEHRLNLALELNPRYVEAIGNLGKIAASRGQMDLAIAQYRRTLKINPKYENSYYNLGTLLGDTGQHEEAVQLLQKALEIEPLDAMAHNNLGNSLFRLNRLEEAIAHLERALQLDGRYAVAHNNLASVYQKQGRMGLAIYHLERALKIDPNNAFMLGNLVKARRMQAEQNGAKP